jgi:restriction endonuclease S subunit
MGELKPGWRRVKFGQLAECVNDRVDDPASAGVERYVGLEHLDPESLTIRRWGTPDEVESTKLRFSPGDIIFGKRRAYQRKLAVADFEGICSAHAMVLRARPHLVLPGFLPYFMQSDVFMERAIEISVGSLSPTINWKTLAEQEFALPPLAEQRRLVELFQAGRVASDSSEGVLAAARAVRKAHSLEVFSLASGIPTPIGAHIEDSTYGPRFDGGLYDVDGAVAQLRTTDIDDDGNINYGAIPCVKAEPKALTAHLLRVGDVVISRSGTCGLTAVFEGHNRPTVAAAFLVRLRTRSTLRPRYLHEFLSSPVGRALSLSLARGGVQKNINASELLNQTMIVPSLSVQDQAVAMLAAARSAEGHARLRHLGTRRMFVSLLNEGLFLGASSCPPT